MQINVSVCLDQHLLHSLVFDPVVNSHPPGTATMDLRQVCFYCYAMQCYCRTCASNHLLASASLHSKNELVSGFSQPCANCSKRFFISKHIYRTGSLKQTDLALLIDIVPPNIKFAKSSRMWLHIYKYHLVWISVLSQTITFRFLPIQPSALDPQPHMLKCSCPANFFEWGTVYHSWRHINKNVLLNYVRRRKVG